jgi:tRNA modification GTPase
MEFNIQITDIINTLLATISNLKSTFNQQQQIRNGIRIAIIGSVNAGKSSLFNALLNQQRSIVTSIAGTTRDAIEAGLYKNNYWTLIDTAGLRTTNDIEQMGIIRSHEQAQKAILLLVLISTINYR